MEREIVISICIMIIFSILKFLDLKYIDGGEMVALKYFVRDAIEVAISSFLGIFICYYCYPIIQSFLHNVTDSKVLDFSSPPVFTDEPGF
jgi:hypothetical protein